MRNPNDDDRNPNDECRMTKETRMTNYRKLRIEKTKDPRKEELHLIFSKIWRN